MAGVTRRRRVAAAAIVGVLVIVAGAFTFVRRVVLRDTTHGVGTDAALDAFRDQTTTTAPPVSAAPAITTPATGTLPPPRLPAAGVYTYRTDGWEHVDVLGGSTHKYPALTTLTVTSAGCGARLHWVILKERVEDWELCSSADGVELGRLGLQTHTFFGRGEENPSICDMPALVVPVVPTAWSGEPEPRHCTLRKSEPWNHTIQRLGPADLMVDGTPVRVVHIRMVIEKAGRWYEHSTIDWWLDDAGLPLQMSSVKESKNDSGVIGDVVYTEKFTVSIVSRTPNT